MKREEQIKNLKDFYDLIIIGGGSSGLALALDASSRGYETLLLERYDFSKGTSSRSTKLLHGGRYLAQGNLSLVYEALHERNQLLINACNLSKKRKFIIPAKSFFKAFYYFIGLKLCDFLAGKFNIGKAKYLNKEKSKNSLKNIKKEELQYGFKS
ncbi:FAD-dependent oxidoreductase [Campylobacter sp. VicNov18]|uniref:FAD-dependent oxidoreductase n=1 Tax=Campylobacter bilis TaxID=2691918 RepID=UPI001D0EFA44|nr:FAD-dependent oxidoreductase [Campylobacter bilis]MCC8278279.1 FAD-dependent oxidoreductase [Campylobacter bilis]MCC8299783.1 FAD-dependent oxidoreductase [Campylobacter bilis]MCC8301188.1 FAD-dependent oxidoreductase [Campylobacter bilis]MCC8350317.1 FAD-dependent oxidoreductase [Campylobacter bilis]MCC8355926.1 FAD-dependent oxidoreductase [Campylobacter bilis]